MFNSYKNLKAERLLNCHLKKSVTVNNKNVFLSINFLFG